MLSRSTRLGVVPALAVALLCVPAAASSQSAAPDHPASAVRQAPPPVTGRVLAISVDGFNTRAIRKLGTDRAPTFYRLLAQGAGTLNARSEYEQNVTLPNHTSMMTSRRIDASRGGHGVTWDNDRTRMTVQRAAGHAVASVFSRVHRAGENTALFTTKEKFGLYDRSWPVAIDRYVADENQQRLVRKAREDLTSTDRAFTFLHVSLPDRTGHAYGGMTKKYLRAVATTDRQLGTIIDAIADDAALRSDVRVILTADHGFAPGARNHSAKVLANYRIPFLVWGDGVAAGDLYDLNPDYRDPGRKRPSYAGRQPVRNGDLGNLALDLLGQGAIPGSLLDADQDLDVS